MLHPRCVAGGAFFALLLGPAVAQAPAPFPTFYAKSYGRRCLDFGPPPQSIGSPVFLFDCNGTVSQQVGVQELVAQASGQVGGIKPLEPHAVLLHTGTTCIASKTNPPTIGTSLELETCGGAAGQQFLLDGDSILLASNRSLVVQPQNARGVSRTPLVLGPRSLSDMEFWDFTPIDGVARKLTSGFRPVLNANDLRNALLNAGPNTVVALDAGADLNFQDLPGPFLVPERVTIRGGRRGTNFGAQITLAPGHRDLSLFQIAGNNARISGLRLHGPGRDPGGSQPGVAGIQANDQFFTLIDHNDLSDWTTAAVNVTGPVDDDLKCQPLTSHTPKVLVIHNFIHDNEERNEGQHSYGYGVASGSDAYPLVQANTFLANVHSIPGDGYARTGYSVFDNIFLSKVIDGSGGDVDVHGETGNNDDHEHVGGIGGTGVEVARNTFLRTGKPNFDLRGTPCSGAIDRFHDNVAVQGRGDAVSWFGGSTLPAFLQASGKFGAPNPTQRLAVGDFDGDRTDDLFLATGAGWYFASAGKTEWRFLSSKTQTFDQLLFGDFDGDGRTDVFTQQGRDWLVSWGGVSPWEKVNQSDPAMSNFAIGDFDGDHRADIFYADGNTWWISSGGVTPFKLFDTSSFRVASLRFGDFNGDGKMDVFSVVSGNWMVTYGGTVNWKLLRSRLTDNVNGLIVADFNGDGRADIATPSCVLRTCQWKVSFGGTGDWTILRQDNGLIAAAAIGRFDGNRTSDILLWHDNYLDIATNGTGSAHRHSNQDMR